ncbi:DUF1223 domain-containing protein [Methylobacterium nigriterrae]|uniref:DUF1223 domain-containing protein n=1 Tax=Methylobacterium nigriterrae TaxID=3127512 RepID=UPI0030141A5C
MSPSHRLPEGAAQTALTERPEVLAFFTSQGCSSCPPAEMLLGEYARHIGVLPLGFHVIY